MTRRPPPTALRPSETQLANVRAEMHDAVNLVCDHWLEVDRQAREMGRGYPSMTGGGGGGYGSDPVGELVVSGVVDPAERAADWLAHLAEAQGHLRNLVTELHGLLPSEPKPPREIPVCAECDIPIPDKVKRLDGEPYHAGACWMRAYRRREKGA